MNADQKIDIICYSCSFILKNFYTIFFSIKELQVLQNFL